MTDLLLLLQEFYRNNKLSAVERHLANARLVGQYDANNTCQHIISPDDVGARVGSVLPTHWIE